MFVYDSDYGGLFKNGCGVIWVCEVLENVGIVFLGRIYLLI